MKILYLTYHGFSSTSGISKKMVYQIEALRSLGNEVHVCSYRVRKDGHRVREINGIVLSDFGKGKWAAFRKRISYGSVVDYVRKNKIEMAFVRSFHNANPFTIHLFQSMRNLGIRVIMEIPTYPYDQEYDGFPLSQRLIQLIDKMFRHQLAAACNAIVTFSNHECIFGQKTIRISNGISFEHVPLRQYENTDGKIHLLGVAEIHYWHGYDRLVKGLGEYYIHGGNRDIVFDIVGALGDDTLYGCTHAEGILPLMEQYAIQQHVILHGAQYGNALDRFFDIADFGIGSLARHRSGINSIKTLKNREYAARGIAFMYSENDSDFDLRPYIYKVEANDIPINIKEMLNFIDNCHISPETIRTSISNLSWKEQMAKVLRSI